MKPYYADPMVTIYHADCQEHLAHMSTAEVVVTDPPYNAINRPTNGLRSLDKGDADTGSIDIDRLAAMFYVLAPSVYVWCSDEQYTHWMSALRAQYSTARKCVWSKTNPSPMNGQHLWLSGVELCAYARRKGAVFNERCKSPVWTGPVARSAGHPTTKPIWLMERLVLASSNPDGMVVDPFCGSGSALVAAKKHGRRSIGFDISEKYCEISAKRCLEQSTGVQ